jgi:polyribonucleotide nucleotidyltransferase
MGSVCGSTLSLMDAGVPIKKPVAGAAMGLVMMENGEFAVLTDIQGMEDALGDMDFKVAGTADGVTALQMDIKIKGITFEVMERALAQAKDARMFILNKMTSTISESRSNLSKYAPRITRIMINPEKIGAVIGPGGKTIRAIAEETKATIDIEDDGTVLVASVSEEGSRRAVQIIEGLTKEVEVGTVYTGRVTRIMAFGAFVEVLPGKEGLVHISELSDQRVGRVEDVVNVGDELTVMVTEIDRMGRINLSRRAVLEGLGGGGARVRDTQVRNGGDGEGDGGRPMGGRPPEGRRDDRGRGPRPGGPPRGGGDRGGGDRRPAGRPGYR